MTKINNGSTIALSKLRKAKTKEEILEILMELSVIIGAVSFQIIPAPNSPFSDVKKLLEFGNFPDWHKKIYETEQGAIVDPSRHFAINNSVPTKWRKIFTNVKGKLERDFIAKLRNNGIRDGISFPIHGPNGTVALLAFGATQFLDFSAEDEDFLSLVAILALQRIKQYLAKQFVSPQRNINLTEREIECLSWVLEGKTNWEIGVLMGVSARTVQFHISNAQQKLDANNRIQAAVKALIVGIIALPFQNDGNGDINFNQFIDLEIKSQIGLQKINANLDMQRV